MNAKKGACNKARSSEEENVGMRDSMRKVYFEHSNKKSNGNSSYEEENQLPKCVRGGNAENLDEKNKENINEEEEIGDVSVGEKVELINKMRK